MEISLSAGITKAINETMIKDRSYPTQEAKSNKGTGVGVS